MIKNDRSVRVGGGCETAGAEVSVEQLHVYKTWRPLKGKSTPDIKLVLIEEEIGEKPVRESLSKRRLQT